MSEHPTFKTADEIAAMKAADPAAFDLDGEQQEETAEAKAERERDEQGRFKAKDAEKADVVDDDKKPEEAAKADEAKPDAKAEDKDDAKPEDMIPKARFGEVVAERNTERQARLAAERELAELKAAQAANQSKDYDAEIEALDKKYDDGDIDFVEYQKQSRALIADKAKAEVLADVAKKDAEKQEQAKQQTWEQAQVAFFDADGNDKYRSDEVLLDALGGAVKRLFAAGHTDFNEVLAKAKEVVDARFAPKADTKHDPHAARKASDAAAASKASAAPPVINGGAGNRSGVENVVDLKTLKPGKFSKNLSVADQEKLLGEGAL